MTDTEYPWGWVLRIAGEDGIGNYPATREALYAAIAERDRYAAALRSIHDLSLLPFDDNDRRAISEQARAALAGVETTAEEPTP